MGETPTPATVTTYRVSREIVHASGEALRQMSSRGIESVVLWQGAVADPDLAIVSELVIPRQVAGPLHFNVPIEERLRLIDVISEKRQIILAQLHTHPKKAFHSPVDDRLAIPQHLGGISIVIPNFARTWTGDLAGTSVNRHLGGAVWEELSVDAVRRMFELT